jgi:hypothetical protein
MAQKQDDCTDNMKTVFNFAHFPPTVKLQVKTEIRGSNYSPKEMVAVQVSLNSTQCRASPFRYTQIADKNLRWGQFIWSVYIYFFWAFFPQIDFFSSPLIQVFRGSSYLPPRLPTTLLRTTNQPPSSCRPLPTHLLLFSPPSLELAN